MSGLIKMSVGNGKKNNIPIIKNLRVDGRINVNNFTIKYKTEDFENTILRHYLIINGKDKKEITKEVGYESKDNEFIYKLNDLNHDTKYNIQIEITDGLDIGTSSILEVKTEKAKIFGIKIDETNSNSSNCVTYINDAIGITPANNTSLNGWQNEFPFKNIRIVGFKNGQVTKAINPNDKKKYVDGSTVPNDVDVMIEIPKIYWNINSLSKSSYEIKISNVKVDSSYDCYAHKVQNVEKDAIYIGAYLGFVNGDKLRSRSGVTPSSNINLTDFRKYAHNVGSGYQVYNWFSYNLLRILYILVFKTLDCQNSLGKGNTNNRISNNGTNDTFGMIYGNKNNESASVTFLGIEDFYGNLAEWIDGVSLNGSSYIMVQKDNFNFNDENTGYTKGDRLYETSGDITSISKSVDSLFMPIKTGGSSSTYYCDYTLLRPNFIGSFGGCYDDRDKAGIFNCEFNYYPSTKTSTIGTRLCYL